MDTASLRVRKICLQQGLVLTPETFQRISQYVDLLLEWNSKINLISRSDVANIWFSHILHSISLLFFIDVPKDASVLDIGTGGGLPGIPLAISRPDLKFTLLDSINKKTNAVEEIVRKLGINNAAIVNGRADDLARGNAMRGSFDVVVSRAVAPLTDLVKWSRPLVRTQNMKNDSTLLNVDSKEFRKPFLLTLKGGDLASEISTAKRMLGLGDSDISTINIVFDGSDELGLVEKKIVIVQL